MLLDLSAEIFPAKTSGGVKKNTPISKAAENNFKRPCE